jgi:predicted DNA-binding protein
MNDNNKKADPTSVRLTEHAKRLLEKLTQKHGVSKAAIIEMAIREKAEKEGVE